MNESDLAFLREIVARSEDRVRAARDALACLELYLLELKAELCRYPPLQPPDLSEGRPHEN